MAEKRMSLKELKDALNKVEDDEKLSKVYIGMGILCESDDILSLMFFEDEETKEFEEMMKFISSPPFKEIEKGFVEPLNDDLDKVVDDDKMLNLEPHEVLIE